MTDRFEDARTRLEFERVRQRVIHYAASEPGKDLLRALSISSSLTEIRSELSTVSEMKRLLEEEGEVPLAGIFQIMSSLHKSAIEGATLQPRELLQIGSSLRAARLLRMFVAKTKERFPLVVSLSEELYTDKVLEYNIDQAIDESGAVKANASRELQSIRRSINERYGHLKKRLENILKNVSDLGFSQDEIITTREGRMVIPVKAEHKNRVPGFIHSASASGATVFIEPTETLELNNEIRNLQFQEQREIEKILRTLTLLVGEAKEYLIRNQTILARLDALHAKAKYSIEVLGVQPVVHSSGPIVLRNARHPVLMMHHGYDGTVPLDLTIGEEFNTLVISGPNAGGKSVAMKCVGLLVLMTQAGLHIPASDQSVVRIFENVFVDIGDDQSIENDLSTFSSHLKNVKHISERANDRSLVLIDEIGAGTDPTEGGALAAAMLELLTNRGTLTIATTHQSGLKAFAHMTPGIENGALEFDNATLTPTYRFRAGIPGSSYAIEMASRLGIERDLLDRAKGFLGREQTKLDSLITELEETAQRYRQDLERVEAEKRRLDTLTREYEQKLAAQSKELKELKRRALVEASEIVDRANAMIERTVREIKETSADRSVVRESRGQVASIREELDKQKQEVLISPQDEDMADLEIGCSVKLAGETEVGQVEAISADRKNAVVVFGNIRMRVPIRNLVHARRPVSRSVTTTLHGDVPQVTLRELDLRGMTGEEAIPLIDKFIDTAVLAGLHRIDIIHGKGTGALRKKVSEFLAGHSRVKTFRLGEWNEGGSGATVVELRE
jgi:DNA mismatch repair protein MutS2